MSSGQQCGDTLQGNTIPRHAFRQRLRSKELAILVFFQKMNPHFRLALRLICFCAALQATTIRSEAQQPKSTPRLQGNRVSQPNIIFILADDLGYGDVGAYGQKRIATRAIDSLSAEGAMLTDFYAGAPVCSPSRCVLITGRHSGHATIRGNTTITGGTIGTKNDKQVRRARLNPAEQTIGTVLQEAGYRTAMMGKWHLDGYDTAATPLQYGFDDFSGWLISYPETYTSTYWPTHWCRDGKVVEVPANKGGKKGYYVADLITDDAIRYMDGARNSDKPFFLMVNHSNPHSPLDAATDSMYRDSVWTADERSYAAMVTSLDGSVSRIRRFLTETGLDSNTIIIFTSDNGPRSEPGETLTHIATFFESNGPLRGYKRDVTEGGIRVPMIFWNPRFFKPGTRITTPAYFPDIMPTLRGMAGRTAPSVQGDGIDLYPHLRGQARHPGNRFLYWEFFEGGFVQAVRHGTWKAIIKNGTLSLFDLSTDIGEKTDVAAQHPEEVAAINSYLKTCRTESPYWPVNAAAGKGVK